MNVKRLLVFGMLGLFMISMMAGVMGEDHETAEQKAERLGGEARSTGEVVFTFFKSLVAYDENSTGRDWIITIFFSIILGMIVFTSLGAFFGDGNKLLVLGVSVVATVIAMMTIDSEYLVALQASYGAMGLTILAVIPFVIILAFTIKVRSRAIARGTWAVFAIYYLWSYGAILINPVINNVTVSRWPYFIAVIVGIAMFFFIGKLRIIFSEEELKADVEHAVEEVKRSTAALKAERLRTKSTTGI